MSKKHNTPPASPAGAPPPAEQSSPVSSTPLATTSPVVSPEPPKEQMTTTTTPPAESTALVPTETQATALAPQSNFDAMKELAAKLPAEYRMDVLSLVRPSPADFAEAIAALPSDVGQKVMTLVSKTNPKKQGLHTVRTGFHPVGIKMFHGTGNDPLRPSKMANGEFYTEDSRVLGESFVGAVLAVQQGRTKWPNKDAGEDGKAPLCSSADRKMGSKYGECAKCAFAKAMYNDGGCGSDTTVFIVDHDYGHIYSVQFSKTSATNGNALIKILETSENIWDRWIQFNIEKRENKEKGHVWYAIKATPLKDTKDPSAEMTDKRTHKLFEMFSKTIDADVHWPRMAAIYSTKKEAAPTLATDVVIDPSQIGGPSIDGDNLDFGGGGKPNV